MGCWMFWAKHAADLGTFGRLVCADFAGKRYRLDLVVAEDGAQDRDLDRTLDGGHVAQRLRGHLREVVAGHKEGRVFFFRYFLRDAPHEAALEDIVVFVGAAPDDFRLLLVKWDKIELSDVEDLAEGFAFFDCVDVGQMFVVEVKGDEVEALFLHQVGGDWAVEAT